MSEQKQAHVVASVDKGMVVGAGSSRHRHAHIRIGLISIGVLIILSVLGLTIYQVVRHRDKNTIRSTVYAPRFSNLSAAESAATDASNKGEFSHALADLQSVTSLQTTSQEKSDLYLRLATVAHNMGNATLAIQYYQKRHSIDSSTVGPDSYDLGELYQQVNEKSQAIAQYQMYISYFQAHSKSTPPYTPDSVIAPIQAQIQALENGK